MRILRILLIILVGVPITCIFGGHSPGIDNNARRLCMEYALRNHEKEFSVSRWEWLKSKGDPNDVEFFYQSCLGHVTGIPATKEYMK